jgi:DnaJ-domain-containing protein 1
MPRPSPFEFDISVSADKRRRTRARGMSGAVESSARRCDKPGCAKPGKYRAPKSRDQLDDYWWFCLDHVREYNQRWNFFEGSSDEELERQFAADRVWERPTRPLRDTVGQSPHAEGRAWARFGLNDPMDLLGDKATLNPAAARAEASRLERRLPPTERRALEILDAREMKTKAEIRKQYKTLVKDLHPDMNAGRRDDEARLAEVVWAWEQIKASRVVPD